MIAAATLPAYFADFADLQPFFDAAAPPPPRAADILCRRAS